MSFIPVESLSRYHISLPPFCVVIRVFLILFKFNLREDL